MAIPEEKLRSWANQGAIETAKLTHKAVERALNASQELKGINFVKYLQGSYKNNTNIRGDSDVDIVIQLNKTYTRNISALPLEEQELYKNASIPATYSLSEFREAVLKALKAYFGDSYVSEGDKCIKIEKSSNRLDADVIVCNQYRKYKRFRSNSDQDFDEGIIFYTNLGREIVSYPKIHYDNGVDKNSIFRTNGWFKSSVRVFKNARSYLVNNGIIDESLAPSFFVECLVYNVPDILFGDNYSNTYEKLVYWLAATLSKDDYINFMCQDRILKLFGDSSEQWDIDKARIFILRLEELWRNW